MAIFARIFDYVVTNIFAFFVFGLMKLNRLQPARPQIRESVMDSSTPSLHTPTVEDVLSVKKILQDMHKESPLPLELIDAIIDFAEYWPHTTTFMDTTVRTDRGNENKFVLRSFPLGFVETTSSEYQMVPEFTSKYAHMNPKPWPESRGIPQDATNEVLEQWKSRSQPRGERPCRKIIFTIKSHDQGWASQRDHHGTYNGSYTWFDVGLERLSAMRESALLEAWEFAPVPQFRLYSASSSAKTTHSNVSPIVCSLQTLLPRIVTVASDLDGSNSPYKFEHPLLPSADLLQKNLTAERNLQENIIEWSYDDHISRDSTKGIELKTKGRGEATLEGNYVRNLKIGDVITVWAKARFGGWVNTVEEVKIDVYWAV